MKFIKPTHFPLFFILTNWIFMQWISHSNHLFRTLSSSSKFSCHEVPSCEYVISSPTPLHATILVWACMASHFTFIGCNGRLLYDFVGFKKTLVTDFSFGSALHHKEGNFQKLTEKSTHEYNQPLVQNHFKL